MVSLTYQNIKIQRYIYKNKAVKSILLRDPDDHLLELYQSQNKN